ncbi:MAG: hypothetical protein R6W72_13170, partial [Desulfurivibrionaceae bacterium]
MIKTILAALLFCLPSAAANLHAADDSSKIVVMPIEFADESLSEGAEVLQEVISDYFKDNHLVLVISEEQREALAGDDTGSREQLIRTVTEKMEGDHALTFSLRRYRERVGDEYSVEDPASLAFEFELIKVENGETICRGRFDETQQPLTENILNFFTAFKRGFK